MTEEITKGIRWDMDFLEDCIRLKTPVIITTSYHEVFAGFIEKIRGDGYVDVRSFAEGQGIRPVIFNGIIDVYSANALIRHEKKTT